MSEIVKVLNMPEELILEAQNVFHTENELKRLLEQMIAHGAKNLMRQKKLWNRVYAECRKQGIEPNDIGTPTFDHITDKFVLMKSYKEEGGV